MSDTTATLTYQQGDATRPEPAGNRLIVHCCNDLGGWGAGFVVALSRRHPGPEAAYRRWHRDGHDDGRPFTLGQVQFVDVDEDLAGTLTVANMIGQHGVRSRRNPTPIRYDAIAAGLDRVAQFCRERDADVHAPRFGAGLAGGSWARIEQLLHDHVVSAGVNVTIYDL